MSGANGTLVVADGGQAGLVLSGFEEAPADKTYQVWVIEDDTPQPAGPVPRRRQRIGRPADAPGSGGRNRRGDGRAAGGVDQPTSDPVLVAPTV